MHSFPNAKKVFQTQVPNENNYPCKWEQLERMKQVEKENEDSIKRLMEAQKEDANKRERDTDFLYSIRGVFRTQSKIYDGAILQK